MIAKVLGAVLAVFAVLLEGVGYLSAGLLAVSLWAVGVAALYGPLIALFLILAGVIPLDK